MNSAPVGSQSYGSHPPGFSLKPGKAGIMELATAPKQSWRSSEESRILSALLVTRALLPWGYSGSSLRSWLSSPQSPRVEQRARVRGVWGGRGDSSAAENRGPGNPAKPPSASRPGRPGLSPPPRARRRRGRGPSGSAEPEPRREAGGCGARLGQPGAAGARGVWEAPAEVWAVPSLRRPGAAPWTPGSCPRSSAPLLRRLAKPGRPRRYPASRTEPPGPAAHLKSCGRPGRGGEGGGGRRRSSPRARGAREEAEREAGWPRAGVRARAGAPERPASPPAPSLSPAPPQTHTHQAPTALRPRRPPRRGQPERATTPPARAARLPGSFRAAS